MMEEFLCIVCNANVLSVDEALHCHSCGRWQHLACTDGITSQFYQQTRCEEKELLDWRCGDCPLSDVISALQCSNLATIHDFERVCLDEPVQESEVTILDPIPTPLEAERQSQSVTYHHVDEGSQKGKERLVDSSGFSYVLKERKGATVYWRCGVRNNKVTCPATVIQKDETYRKGARDHVHQALPGLFKSSLAVKEVKRKAREDVFRSAPVIVGEVMSRAMTETDDRAAMPNLKPSNLARTANRVRQRLRKADPASISFEISLSDS